MIWLHVTAGRGPNECHFCIFKIFPVIEAESKIFNLTTTAIDSEPSKHGLASILIAIEGEREVEFAKSWNGSVQWIWKSTIRPEHKRKRWFIGVRSLTLETFSTVNVIDSDLKFESMKASGPGGQHVNKTESAIRLIHIPTGIIVTAQEERSQHLNKSLAKARLLHQLQDIQDAKLSSQSRQLWDDHNSVERGNAIRTYEGLEFRLKGRVLDMIC